MNNQKITLTRQIIGHDLHVAPSWISNGHWAIARARVSNAALCTAEAGRAAFKLDTEPRTLSDDNVARIIAGILPKVRTWIVSSWVFESTAGVRRRGKAGSTSKYRLAVAVDNGEPAYFDAAYLDALGIVPGSTLYGSDNRSAFVDRFAGEGEPADSIVIMPFRAEADVTAITSVVNYEAAREARTKAA